MYEKEEAEDVLRARRSALEAAIDAYAEARAHDEAIREISGKYSVSAAKVCQRRRAAVTKALDDVVRVRVGA